MLDRIKTACLILALMATASPLCTAQGNEKDAKDVPMLRELPLLGDLFKSKQAEQEETAARKEGVPFLSDIPIISFLFKKQPQEIDGIQVGGLKDINTGKPVQEEDPSSTGIRRRAKAKPSNNLPTIGTLFDDRAPSIAPMKEPGATVERTPFLQRRQAQYILDKIAGIESIEMVETRKTELNRKSTKTTSTCELRFDGHEEAREKADMLVEKWKTQDGRIIEIQFCLVERKTTSASRPSPSEFRAIPTSEYNSLLTSFKQDSKYTIVNAPRLSILQGQRANISILNQIAYVKDYDVEIASASFVMDPIIDTVSDGIIIEATPVIDADGNGLALEMEVAISSVKRPIETLELPVAGVESNVTIQLPEVNYSLKRTSDLHLTKKKMAFRVSGLRSFRGNWEDDNVCIDVLGLATIHEKK